MPTDFKRAKFEWSRPLALEDLHVLPREPGVYRLLALKSSRPAPISRLLGVDPDGIPYIGKATRLRGRVGALGRCIRDQAREHAAGRRFHQIDRLRARAGLPRFSRMFDLRISFLVRRSVEAARSTETKVLHDYIARYGEVSPLNGQGNWSSVV
jgi:hypothetical protein